MVADLHRVYNPGMENLIIPTKEEDDHIRKSHNVSLLLYHLVCPVKYRKAIIFDEVEKVIRDICLEISERHEIYFVEIGMESDHVHFLIQSVPTYCPTQIVMTVKANIAKEVFRLRPEVKEMLWGGEFWTDGYYINTVGRYGNKDVIRRYIAQQGKQEADYKQIHSNQLTLF